MFDLRRMKEAKLASPLINTTHSTLHISEIAINYTHVINDAIV